jgi:hypothetical protein
MGEVMKILHRKGRVTRYGKKRWKLRQAEKLSSP